MQKLPTKLQLSISTQLTSYSVQKGFRVTLYTSLKFDFCFHNLIFLGTFSDIWVCDFIIGYFIPGNLEVVGHGANYYAYDYVLYMYN